MTSFGSFTAASAQFSRQPSSALFPCLADKETRSSLCLKVVLVLLHVVIIGVLFALDDDLRRRARIQTWYIFIYSALILVTLAQYFFTSYSSPGYVIDAMRAGSGTHATFTSTSDITRRQTGTRDRPSDSSSQSNSSIWLKHVMDLYPPGFPSRNWTCSYCNAIQPPRSKHCHDCDRCILQFDHHCAWLGTCIGQGNHCRFWWYIFEETILCTWTSVMYISFLRSTDEKPWWNDLVAIVMLTVLVFALIFLILLLLFHSYLALTNQTTYELMRRRRLLYLRGLPNKVHPFSKGICKNLSEFCCSFSNTYKLDAVPTIEEWEARARPYTCIDIISGRCW